MLIVRQPTEQPVASFVQYSSMAICGSKGASGIRKRRRKSTHARESLFSYYYPGSARTLMISLWLFVDPLINSVAHLRIPDDGARITRQSDQLRENRPVTIVKTPLLPSCM
ncbi:hypothetical protein J3459_010746 [Metarhizium acridum]|nr:hypothetical protein J3459_010746 [Metarhizium acridum]